MDCVSQKDIEIALRALEAARARSRRCYEKNREERKAKRRAHYHAQKEKKGVEVGGEGVAGEGGALIV